MSVRHGDNLAAVLRAAEVSGSELARRLGVPPQRVNDWLNRYDSIELENLLKICVALQVPIDALVAGTNPDYDTMRSDLVGHTGTGESPIGTPHHAAATRVLEESNRATRAILDALIDDIEARVTETRNTLHKRQVQDASRSPASRRKNHGKRHRSAS